jgi:hypothetical protein
MVEIEKPLNGDGGRLWNDLLKVAPGRDHRRPSRHYIRPASVDDLVDHAIGRVLDLLDIDSDLPHR